MIRKKKNGISLTEFLVVFAIFLTVSVGAIQAYMFLSKSFYIMRLYLTFYLKGRETIDFISKDCRVAIRVMDTYGAYTTTDDNLILKMPSIDSSGDIIDINNEFDYMVYRIAGNDLMKTVIPGSASSRPAYDGVFKENIQSLYITYDGTPLSSVTNKSSIKHLTLSASIGETVMGTNYQINPGTTIKLMNYEWEFVR